MKQKPSDLFPVMPWEANSVTLSGGASGRILSASPGRAGFMVAYSRGSGPVTDAQVNIWISEDVSDTIGIRIDSSNPWFIASWRDLGPIINQEWFAVYNQSGGGGSAGIVVYEFDYQPQNFGVY